jgi:DNA repair exonuclease SbcCD ATPase subunit
MGNGSARVTGFISIVAVYGVVNFLLYGAQEMYHANDKRAYEALSQLMEQRKSDIEARRSQIQALEASIEERGSQIDRLKAELRSIEQQYGSTGAPTSVYVRYEDMRVEVNGLIDQIKPMIERYSQLVDSFNAEVDGYNSQISQLNDLSHRAFDRWILIPIPLGRRAPAGELGRARGLSPVPAH